MDTREYKRPDELKLLTEEEIQALYQADIELQKKDNAENDYDYPNQMNRYTRKWTKWKISNASSWWKAISYLNTDHFNELVYWLSVPDEPCNPHDNGLSKTKQLARDIKYVMTPKQRAVAYKIITERYNRGN